MRPVAFDQSPFIAIWETTQACEMACRHCRASAQPEPLPGELTVREGRALLEEIAGLGTQVCVLSGGDPLKRADLCALIRHGKSLGLRMGTIPAATPRLTRAVVWSFKEAGLDQMALSLDFSTADAHDAFRRTPGAFATVQDAVEWAHEVGLPVQINTVISALNVEELDALIALVRRLGIVFWEVFFLVPVGRALGSARHFLASGEGTGSVGRALGGGVEGVSAAQYEQVFERLYELALAAPFTVKVTEAMHFRRYAAQRRAAARPDDTMAANGHTAVPHGGRSAIGLSPHVVNAGKGHVFISSTGEVCPSGFLPLSAGNIRDATLAELYRRHPLFLALRDPNRLKGRCGLCEYRHLCGGSRARAYAATGDYLAEDPGCTYLPAAMRRHAGMPWI